MEQSTRERLRELLTSAKALLDSMTASIRADADSVWKYASYRTYVRKYNALAQASAELVRIEPPLDLYDLERIPGNADTIAMQQKELFEAVHANLSVLKAFLENKLGVKADQIQGLTDFFQASLRKAMSVAPEREVEVQNAVEVLLIGRGFLKGVDYDRETGRVKVSIKEVVPDFVLPKLGMAIEVKLCKDKGKSKAIVDQVNADIMAYSKAYSSLLFIIYDLGVIRDELEFKRDLEAADGVSVVIVKH